MHRRYVSQKKKNTVGNDVNETARDKQQERRKTTIRTAREEERKRECGIGDAGVEGERTRRGPNKILIKFYNLETTLSRALCAASELKPLSRERRQRRHVFVLRGIRERNGWLHTSSPSFFLSFSLARHRGT